MKIAEHNATVRIQTPTELHGNLSAEYGSVLCKRLTGMCGSRSILFASTSKGVVANSRSSSNLCNSMRACGTCWRAFASTTYIITSHPRVYRPHSLLYCACPPISQHFMVTPPFFTNLTFKPIVGHVSTETPLARTFSSVVFPEFSRPTKTHSSFLLKEEKYA